MLGFALSTGSALPLNLGLQLGYHGETGVEAKAVTTLLGSACLHQCIRADAGLQLSHFQHCGISAYSTGMVLQLSPPNRISLAAVLQHQQWNDWQAAENRFAALFSTRPSHRIGIGLGLCYRSLITDPDRYRQPFIFPTAAAEWNILYSLNWRLWQQEQWSLAAELANIDRFSIHNPQQFPLAVITEWSPRSNLLLWAKIRTAIKYISFSKWGQK